MERLLSSSDMILKNLFILSDANLATLEEQPFIKQAEFNSFVIDSIFAIGSSGDADSACVGGIYNGYKSKGSSQLVSALQNWDALLTTNEERRDIDDTEVVNVLTRRKFLKLQLEVITEVLFTVPVLALSVESRSRAFADVYINGFIIS